MRRSLWIGLQIALAVAVAYAVLGALGRSWAELTSSGIRLALRPGPIALAGVVVLLTYGVLIESWRRVLAGWGQDIPYATAARIWAVSNLGRYLPGKIWAVAGMAALARRAGVAPWAAMGSALVLQALAIGTGAALVTATIPAAAPHAALLAALGLAAATVAAVTWPPLARPILRVATRFGVDELPPLAPPAVLLGVAATLSAWVAYGLGLKLWAAGTLPAGAAALTLAMAVGAFSASYVVGLLAVFAPGGLFVREGVMFSLLAGPLGPGNALALAVGSRLLLTIMEIIAALIGMAWPNRNAHGARAD